MRQKEIPILLLTGYLGSGKTTLVNRILANKRGIRFAVIVNDIGEVNIDADLIQKGGVVAQKDDSLVALQNGCICCTLKADLIEQVYELMKAERFDYIVIEASGICEPEPIAQTLCSIPRLGDAYTRHGICRLDCLTCVVDALRLQSEFACGDNLTRKGLDEEDIENLIIQQIEFCNIILLNKAAEVKPEELGRIKKIIRTLQPSAEIIECNYADVPLEKLLDTHLFNFERAATSAGWIREIERAATEEEEREAHAHGGHHHEEHEHEAEGHHHHHHFIGAVFLYQVAQNELGLWQKFIDGGCQAVDAFHNLRDQDCQEDGNHRYGKQQSNQDTQPAASARSHRIAKELGEHLLFQPVEHRIEDICQCSAVDKRNQQIDHASEHPSDGGVFID